MDEKKLKHLFEHWIDHNKEHVLKYEEWSKKLEEEGYEEVANLLKNAIEKFKEGEKFLKMAKEKFEH